MPSTQHGGLSLGLFVFLNEASQISHTYGQREGVVETFCCFYTELITFSNLQNTPFIKDNYAIIFSLMTGIGSQSGFDNNIIIAFCELSSRQMNLYIKFLIKAINILTLDIQNRLTDTCTAPPQLFQNNSLTIIIGSLKLT